MFNKTEAKREASDRFVLFPYGQKVHSLIDVCIDLSDEWAAGQTETSPRAQRKALKSYLMERIDLKDPTKSYFVPSFVWTFLAKMIISWIIKWIINNYIIND